ncbi:Lsr2 family DNA-binding protein [Kitasatospora viridis]|uniref:Lsr2 protein n=1 Tax=Kitasatospora viridis TaxID=281105 RepID=A0A561UKR1_9ACTN|nr:Lsr2 family protein [Kitasatospora viridis]TWF99950.1 Lsr2 protein [Kitasatospora viridis]
MDAETAVAVSLYKNGATVADIAEVTGLTQHELAAAVTGTGAPFAVRTPTNDPSGMLITWGQQHGTKGMQRLAETARNALAGLQEAHRNEAVVEAARARVRAAREQLATAEQALRTAQGTAPKKSAAAAPAVPRPDRAEGALIREWARARGHQVGSAGAIAQDLIVAYRAEHPRADAA